MGRSMPVYCQHHKMVDGGDFGGEAETCEVCEAEHAAAIATTESQLGIMRAQRERILELESKLEGAVLFRRRPESDEWQADFGDHHAVGKTKERAIFELGMYLMRKAVPK